MAAIISVIAVVLISMLINRVATIALALTGMSREEARSLVVYGRETRISELDRRGCGASGDAAHAQASRLH